MSMGCSTVVLPGGVLSSSSSTARSCAWLGVQRQACCTSVKSRLPFAIKAVSAPEECNEEECAPEKEVGKVSLEWKAEESTKVLGTYPPMSSKRKWTGYVEKDTAGQTNIYAVEPTVYVSENVISSNTAGDSSTGSEQTLLVSVGLALGLLVGAGVVLQWVSSSSSSSNTPVASDAASSSSSYTGPSLSYYIQKFKQPSVTTTTVVVPAPPPEQTTSSSSTAIPSLITNNY